MKYKVNIKRFNGIESWFQTYEVDLDKKLNVLEVVEYIKNYIDPTLTYRAFCKSAICGSCAMVINGTSKLSCKIKAIDFLEDGVLNIEPLKHFDVIKDLVVNQQNGFDKLNKIKPFIENKTPPENSEFLILPDEVETYDNQTDCILCMSCYSDCSALENDEKYIGPFQFTKSLRFINDSRDKTAINERLDKIMGEGNIFECIECQACILACPKGIKPQFDIKKLQSIAMANGYQNPIQQQTFDSFGGFDDFGGFNPNGF